MAWTLEGHIPVIWFLIRDNDRKFPQGFDAGFRSTWIDVSHTPYQAPNADAFAERWVRSVRAECLNKLMIIDDRRLQAVMREFVAYHNTGRPHQLHQRVPMPCTMPPGTGSVQCRDVLDGIVHDYFREAA